MNSRFTAWISQIRAARFLQVLLGVGVVVLLMTRAARPLGFWPGAAVAVTILLPNLALKRFRPSVWLVSIFAAHAVLFVTRLLPLTNASLYPVCEVSAEGGDRYSELLDLPETRALLWFGAALATGVLLRFVDRGMSGKVGAGSWRLLVAGGLWLAAAGGVSRCDEILRVPHHARCDCARDDRSLAEMICPNTTSECAAADRDLYEVTCIPLVSPLARAGAKAAWGVIGIGLLLAAAGGYTGWAHRSADTPTSPSPMEPEARPVIHAWLLFAAFAVIPFFFLGLYQAVLVEVPDLPYLVSSRALEWLSTPGGP